MSLRNFLVVFGIAALLLMSVGCGGGDDPSDGADRREEVQSASGCADLETVGESLLDEAEEVGASESNVNLLVDQLNARAEELGCEGMDFAAG